MDQLTEQANRRRAERFQRAVRQHATGPAVILSGGGDLLGAARFLAEAMECEGAEGDIPCGRNAQGALRALGRTAEVVCVAAAWSGAPAADLADADAVAAHPADLPAILQNL